MKKRVLSILFVIAIMAAVNVGCSSSKSANQQPSQQTYQQQTSQPQQVQQAPVTYTILANAGNGGTINPSGNISVISGGNETFTIYPGANSQVANLVVDGVSEGVPTSWQFNDVTTNHTINVSFATWETQTQNLVNATITVSPGYHDIPFSVNLSTMTSPTVTGSFTASGGSGNDINVIIMNSTDFINWSNKHQVYPLYSSGQLTTGNINVPITVSGQYYLVFDNTFSTFSSKNVTTNVNLNWSELVNQ